MNEKKFDCVRMKAEIQQQIMKEFAGLTEADQRRRTEEMIKADPVLARVWRLGRRRQAAVPRALQE